MGAVTLVTGGVRSGKSSFALSYAQNKDGLKTFIATAVPFDNEMEIRIKNHQSERGESFVTIEEPYELADAVKSVNPEHSIAVIDCLTVWLGNLFYKFDSDTNRINLSIDNLITALENSGNEIIIVTNEVGWGIVPENKLSREFRDTNGFMNQRIAKIAKHVILCVSGIPVTIK